MARKVSKKTRRSKKKRSTGTPTRRRLTATKPKRKTAQKKSVAAPTLAAKQLAVYHNPFSRATKQPKIPDGKLPESLGFQTQTVGTLLATNVDNVGTSGLDTTGMMHILMFPGMNGGALVINDLKGAYLNESSTNAAFTNIPSKHTILGYLGSNDCNFSSVTNSGGIISNSYQYANWRIVSQGMVLSLLNPQEKDDGWWESCRVHEGMDSFDYMIGTRKNSGDKAKGCLIPYNMLATLKTREIANETSYATGLLRDLKNNKFVLSPQRHEHDVIQQYDTFQMSVDDIGSSPNSALLGLGVQFGSGEDAAMAWIKSRIDMGLDMIYIRVHGRSSGEGTRLHYNLVSNQEITFESNEREARFHTGSAKVANISDHHAVAQATSASAVTVIAP